MFFRCNNMYQPVLSTFSLHCKRFAYISTLCFPAFLFSLPSIIIWRTASAHYYPEHSLSRPRNTCKAKSLSPKTQREEKKLLDDGGLLLVTSLAVLDSCLLLSIPFWPTETCFHTKLQTSWRGKGGNTTLFCLSFFSFRFFFAHFPPYPAISQEALHKHKKQMCFSQLPKKKKRTFFSKTFLPCVTVTMIKTCIGCLMPMQVWMFPCFM